MQSINNSIIGCNAGNIKLAGPDNFAYYKILDKEILLFGESHTLIPKNNYNLDIYNFFYNIGNRIPAESCIDFFIEDSFDETYEKYNQNGGSKYTYILNNYAFSIPAVLFDSVEYDNNTYSGGDIKKKENELNGFPEGTIVTIDSKKFTIKKKGPFYIKYKMIELLRYVFKDLFYKKTKKNDNKRYHFWDIAQHSKKFHPSWSRIKFMDGLETFDENTFKNLCRLFLGQFDLITENDAEIVYNRYVENIKSSNIDPTFIDELNFDIIFIKYVGMKINKQLDNVMIFSFKKTQFVEDMIDYFWKKSSDRYEQYSNLRMIMTDIYSFARMFRNFNKYKIRKNVCDQYSTPNKIVYYGGSLHLQNIVYMLEYLFPSTPPIMKDLNPDTNKYVIMPKHNYFGLDTNKLFDKLISRKHLDKLYVEYILYSPIERLIMNCNSKK